MDQSSKEFADTMTRLYGGEEAVFESLVTKLRTAFHYSGLQDLSGEEYCALYEPDLDEERPSTAVQVIVPEAGSDFVCEFGWCESCGAELASNWKYICCPLCGTPSYLT